MAIDSVLTLPPSVRVIEHRRVGAGGAICDLVASPAGLIIATTCGHVELVAAGAKPRLIRAAGRLGVGYPCRIATTTARDIVLWGNEALEIITLDGALVRELYVGHSLDYQDGYCAHLDRFVMLPDRQILDLASGELMEGDTAQRLFEEFGSFLADGSGGILLAGVGGLVARWTPDGEISTVMQFPGEICALVAADPITAVLDGGRIVTQGDPGELRFELELRRTDGRAVHYPGWPEEAWLHRDEASVTIVANDRVDIGGCLSGVASWVNGERTFTREARGPSLLAVGGPIALVPDGWIRLGPRVEEIAVPGLVATAALVHGDVFYVGTSAGELVAFMV